MWWNVKEIQERKELKDNKLPVHSLATYELRAYMASQTDNIEIWSQALASDLFQMNVLFDKVIRQLLNSVQQTE